MCGIFGHIGEGDSAHICIEGLKSLEYRGYDSAGIAGILEGKLYSRKEIGKISALEQALLKQPLPLDLAIAHTRWATHGIPTQENAHPHFDQSLSVAVVHNGIIENHQMLRSQLKAGGVLFRSDTDTEVIAQLISHFYEGDLLKAVRDALAIMQGFWGIAVIHKNHPETIVAAARENPLAIALNPKTREAFVSSDANAFQGEDLEVIFLHKGDVALVSAGHAEIYDETNTLVKRPVEKCSSQSRTLSKNGFEHFMLKEIFEQPHTIQQAIHQRLNEEEGTAQFERLGFSPQELLGVKNVLILACGTSWHAGLIAALLLEDRARLPAQAEIASEFRHRNALISPETLVIAISQSGETLDTLGAVREAKQKGAKVLALCNVPGSTLTREAAGTLFLKAGPEISVCSTKAFTSQLSVLALFALYLARLRGCMTLDEGRCFLSALQEIPTLVHQVLSQSDLLQKAAQKYAGFSHFFFLGRHYMFGAALEAALKFKEISYLHAIAYPAGEMKHGPIALLDPKLPVIGLLGSERTYDKILSNLMEVKARKAPLLAFAPQGAPQIAEIADDIIWMPKVSDEFACIPYAVACQLFAYYAAKELGTDIDQPRNLAKSVTVE